jgi:TolA-binding protein
MRTDQEQRLRALETAVRAGPVAAPSDNLPSQAVNQPPPPSARPPAPVIVNTATAPIGDSDAVDAAEASYNEGFHLWQDKKYDAAIASLRATASSFPKSKWVSWANNLAGRAMLDKGQARAAAEALLANYRSNPKGERAADSLYYLGQSLKKLGQPEQACKAYGELEAVYGGSMRGELQRLLPGAKADAGCS